MVHALDSNRHSFSAITLVASMKKEFTQSPRMATVPSQLMAIIPNGR